MLRAPRNWNEVRQLLGIVNYYRKFMPDMAASAKPIYVILKDKKKWTWNKLEEDSLRKIKETISRREALAPFETRSERKVRLICDACEEGMGGVLEQEQANGQFMSVLYWSSLFRTYERNYAILEKEALAYVAAVGKLKKYLLGRRFLLRTDHRSLETLLSQGNCGRTGPRIERWRERLSCYDYDVEYIKGDGGLAIPICTPKQSLGNAVSG